MSFGVSLGDFLAVGKIVTDISSSLRSSGGSKSEYQELQRELDTLQQILQQIDQLGTKTHHKSLEYIKYAALSCRLPLEQFLETVKTYEKSLGVWSQPGMFRGATQKVRWGLGEKGEVRKLQSYLSMHVGMLNTLLHRLGLDVMDAGFANLSTSTRQIKQDMDETQQSVARIEHTVKAQQNAVTELSSSLPKAIWMLGQQFGSSIGSLACLLTRVCESTEQIRTILQAQATVPTVDTRWTFLQDPVIVEDALGRKFPVPSEYDTELLNTIVRHKFSSGDGQYQVQEGLFEFFYSNDTEQALSLSEPLRPGAQITMAIVCYDPVGYQGACPKCYLSVFEGDLELTSTYNRDGIFGVYIKRYLKDEDERPSLTTKIIPDGRLECCRCGLRFDIIAKSLYPYHGHCPVSSTLTLWEIDPPIKVSIDYNWGNSVYQRRMTAPSRLAFRNIRWYHKKTVCIEDAVHWH